MSLLTLHIHAASTPPGWSGQWFLGEAKAGSAIDLTGDAATAIADLGEQFLELFEQPSGRPIVGTEGLRNFGWSLFDAWFAPARAELAEVLNAPGPHELRVCSTDGQALNWPWELVELTPNLPLGCDAAWTLRRTLKQTLANDLQARGGPLRVLFLAAAPTNQHLLDFEREEDAMLKAVSRLGGEVVLHFAETGGIDELATLVGECKPQVVHLSGHGEVRDGHGCFAFEDERGGTDLRRAGDIVTDVFRGSGVRLVFLNGCQTSQAAVAGLCQALVAADVPLALGWSASVADDLATDFAEAFYRRLVHGEPVPAAIAHARDAIRRKGQYRHEGNDLQDATFALPQLYAATSSALVFEPAAPREHYQGPRTVYALLGDGVTGLTEGYVGRRRVGQRLVPALREGKTTFAVLTGIGGTGKSTLATRAVNRLEATGFRRVPIRAEGKNPPEAARKLLSRIIAALDLEFVRARRDDLHELLTDGKLSVGHRLRFAVDGLNELKLALVLDNFEDAIDLETRRIADPDLAEFYAVLASHLVRGSRALVTCRYLPEGTPDLANVLHEPLPEFPEHDFLKFLRRDDRIERRMSVDLTPALLKRLYRMLGGTPGLLDQVRKVLRTADANALLEELKGAPGMLGKAREQHYAKILATRLYDALSPPARCVASRLALSELPLPADAVEKLADLDESAALQALQEGIAYGLLQRFDEPDLPTLFQPPGLLRPWLSAPDRLADDERLAAHRQLAAFWRASFEAKRERELRVPIDVELETCRVHAQRGDDVETLRWAVMQLVWFLEKLSEWHHARELLEGIREEDQDACVWHELASIDVNQGNYVAARDRCTRTLAIQQAIGDRAGEAATLHLLAMIDVYQSDYAVARKGFERALAILQATGNRAAEATTWHNLASISLNQGDYAAAREGFERAMAIRQAIEDSIGEATTCYQLACIDLHQGNYAAAREGFERALIIDQAFGDRAGEAATRHNLASVDLNQGEYIAAREGYKRALTIRQAIGDRAGEAGTWHQLATIDLNQGNYAAAREGYEQAMAIRQAIGDRAGEAATWHNLATIDLNQGDYAAARDGFARSLAIKQAIGNRADEAATWHQLATIDVHQGEYATAREGFVRSLVIKQAIGDRAGEANTLQYLGGLAYELGRTESGVLLIAIGWMILQVIGHGEAEGVFQTLSSCCSLLEYDQARFDVMQEDAAANYKEDGCRGLIERTFAGL